MIKNSFIMRLFALSVFLTTSCLFAKITGSKHDLQPSDDSINEDLCVYCHTPNMPASTFTSSPLWSSGEKVQSFIVYGSGSGEKEDIVNSPSMACLGCHDGVNAINSVVNTSSPAGMVDAGMSGFKVDKSRDHPVSVPYVEGASSLRPKGTHLSASSGYEWQGATTISDLLRGTNSDRVECGSCHDPHMGENPTFLRVPANAKSSLCLGCHKK